jgi:hypothetical protein
MSAALCLRESWRCAEEEVEASNRWRCPWDSRHARSAFITSAKR